MSELIKELTIEVYVNEMLTKDAPLTPTYKILDKKYFKFKCTFNRIRDENREYEIYYKVKYCEGFKLFHTWYDCGVFSIYSEGRIHDLIEQCEQFLAQEGYDVITGKSSWS